MVLALSCLSLVETSPFKSNSKSKQHSCTVTMNRVVTQEQNGGMDVGAAAAFGQEPAAFASSNNSSMICMSVVADGPRIAFAAYNEEQNQIVVDVCVADGYEAQSTVERILATVRPTLLLLSSKIIANDNLLGILTIPPEQPLEPAEIDAGGENAANGVNPTLNNTTGAPATVPPPATIAGGRNKPRSIPYRLMKTAAFDIRNCNALILNKLRVRSLMNQQQQQQQGAAGRGGVPFDNNRGRHFPNATGMNNQDQQFRVASYHAIAAVVDFESTAQVQAVGSLLSFLQATIFRMEEGGSMTVNDVVQARASMYMNISSSTLSALHVFSTEHHPLVAKGAGNSKEGVSLFSLLDRTMSRAGRKRLREWMLRPLLDLDAIAMRQDGVELFMLPEMQSPAGKILKLLESIGPIEQILVRIQKCSTKPSDFLTLSRALAAAAAIHSSLGEILWSLRQRAGPDPAQLVQEGAGVPMETWGTGTDPQSEHYLAFLDTILSCCKMPLLQQLHERIGSIVNEEATNELQCVVIKRGYNEHLDTEKDKYSRLGETLKVVGSEMQEGLPYLRGLVNVIFIPQVGFLVALAEHHSWRLDGQLPEDFKYIFTQDDFCYFKNPDVSSLDDSIGDLDSSIKDTELLLVAELEDDILECENELRETFNALADLDCILAFASCADDLKYVRPEVVPADENCINITNGRHPLQEIIIDGDFIPNNTATNATDRVNIVTGPNFSGKSCYARQVGLIVYMAHIGSFVPCDTARLSVTEQILARFSSVETCTVPQSSFQLDLSQMGSILRRSSSTSLVLIDEFGKGTSPASGIALLTAALQKLATTQCKAICTTHFLEIFSMELLRDGESGIKALRMAVQVPKTTEEIPAPLFKLEEGVASSSAGLVCAKMAGVKNAVIERATEIVQAMKYRRQVKPLPEILRRTLGLSPLAKDALGQFISTDWNGASDDQLNHFLSKVDQM